MDRLKKRLEEFRLRVRKWIDRCWHNQPEGDVFRSLDVLFVLGGVHYEPSKMWHRIAWNACGFITYCGLTIAVLNLVDQLQEGFDVLKVTWYATVVVATTLCFLKDVILNRNFDSIQTARDFINSKPFDSGDKLSDSQQRKKFFQRLQLMAAVYHVVWLLDHVLINLPNSGINEYYGTPRLISRLGPTLANGIHVLFILTLCPIWFNKYHAGSGLICSLLYGFHTEYEIFVQGFENTLDRVYSDVEIALPSTFQAAPEWKRMRRDKLYWKYLKKHVIDQLKQHIQLVETLQLLQPIVQNLFGVIYYNAIVLISPVIYVLWLKGLSPVTVLLVSIITFFSLECYVWCSIIESFQDINENLEVEILNIIANIPYSPTHHQEYVEMRTTLLTMKTFVRNDQQYSCGGVFAINVEEFRNLTDVAYSVLTFLLDVGVDDGQKN